MALSIEIRFKGACLGALLGDALGGPIEMWPRSKILAFFGARGLTTFVDPKALRTDEVPEHIKAGTWSDDWGQTACIIRSFVRCHDLDVRDIMLEHLKDYRQTPYGWGGNTKEAMEEMSPWFESKGKEGRDPLTPRAYQPGKGAGNGVAMKASPIGYLMACGAALDHQKAIFHLGMATHGDPRATVAGFAIAELHATLYRHWGRVLLRTQRPRSTREEILRELLNSVMEFEALMQRRFGIAPAPPGQPSFSDALSRLLEEGMLDDPWKLQAEIGNSSRCWESVPFAIGTFLRHPTAFRAGVLEAVNAGDEKGQADADTNASMVGALIGNVVGLEAIPHDWRTFRPEFEQAPKLAQELIATIEQMTATSL